MRHVTAVALLVAGSMLIGAGCNRDKHESTPIRAQAGGQNTLWYRLGGEDSVRAVVKRFVQKGASNPKVNFTREGHPNRWTPTEKNVRLLEQRLVEFISEASGGPLKYTGRDMATVHRDMRITSAEFDALANDLAATLDEFKVPEKEKNELLTAVARTKPNIVGK